jgi:DNA-binding transcriptional LysR family regulator
VDVELRQLEALVAVAEERSFTAAAGRLHLTQQSVSALVRRLETNLGVTLFDRTTRRVEPTPACEALLEEVRAALRILHDALARARHTGLSEFPLRLAFTPATSFGSLHDLLDAADNARLAPLQVRELWADELPDAIRDGRFDAGIGVEVQHAPGLDVRPWRRQRVDLLVAATHPLANQSSVAVAQLEGIALAITERASNVALHDALVATFTRAGVWPLIIQTPRVSGSVPAEVVRGTAVSLWLTGMNDRYIPHGLVRVPLEEPETLVTISFVTASGPRPVETRRSLEALREAVARTSTC